jgi:chemotaxis signal transduction protein
MVTTLRAATAGKLVRLKVGPFTAALSVERILGVERGDRIQRAGSATDGLTLVNSIGTFRVFELSELLGMTHSIPPRSGQVLLTEVMGERVGVWVEKVTQLNTAEPPRLVEAPTALRAGGRFASAALLDDGPLPVLDLDRLFDPHDEPAVLDFSLPRRSVESSVSRTSRLIVVGQFEYPGPGGRVVGFGLSARCVDEITDLDKLSAVPLAPTHVRGLLEWRGRGVPKVDLAAWCGLPASSIQSDRVVVVKTGGRERVAVATGGTVQAIGADDPHIDARLSLPVRSDRVLGMYEFPGMTVVVPDLTRIGDQ